MMYFWFIPVALLILAVVFYVWKSGRKATNQGTSRLDEARKQD